MGDEEQLEPNIVEPKPNFLLRAIFRSMLWLGILVGHVMRLVPVVLYYVLATIVISLAWNGTIRSMWNWLPSVWAVEVLVFVIALRVVGALLRGERNPFHRQVQTWSSYE